MTENERQEILDYLPIYARERLEHIQGHKDRYVCPFCGHGRGSLCFSVFQSGGTWLWKCHHGDCLRGGDFFKLIAYRDGLDVRRDWPQVIQAAALEAGVIVTDDRPRTAEERAEAIRKKQQRQRLDAVKDHLRQWYTDTLDILRQCYTVLDRDTERPQGDKYGDFARLRIDEIEQLYDYFYDLRNNGAIWWTLIELYRDPTFKDRIERMKRYSEDRRTKQ
jgi:hypothetical protein